MGVNFSGRVGSGDEHVCVLGGGGPNAADMLIPADHHNLTIHHFWRRV